MKMPIPDRRDALSRRTFIKKTAAADSVTALASSLAPGVQTGGTDELKIGLIGCGGRGTSSGRMSAYTGRAMKWDWAMNASKLDLSPSKHEFGDLPVDPVARPGTTKLQ